MIIKLHRERTTPRYNMYTAQKDGEFICSLYLPKSQSAPDEIDVEVKIG